MSEHQKTTQVILTNMDAPKEHQTIEKLAIFVEIEPGVFENLIVSNSEALGSLFVAIGELDERITALEEA